MTSEQIAALIAAVPSVAALVWVIVRQQSQLDTLIAQLIINNKMLLDLHPPQTPAGAAQKLKTSVSEEKS